MGLSVFQSLAIGGGKAAEVIRETENKRKNGIKNALFKSIEDSVAPASEYRQKHLLVKNKAKEDIESLISTYFTEETLTGVELSRPQKVAAAQALYSKYGYNREKVDNAYQSRFTSSKKLGSNDFNTMSFLNSEFQSLKNIDSNMDLDTVTSILAQKKVGAAPTGFKSSMALIKEMDQGQSILTDPINYDSVQSKTEASFGLPKAVEGELPIVPVKPRYDHNKVIDEVQKYRMNESTIKKNQDALKKSGTWKVSDWRGNYKDLSNAAVKASGLQYDVKFINGETVLSLPGDAKDTEKRIVERAALRNFVVGTVAGNRHTDSNFIQVVNGIAASVEALPIPEKENQYVPGMLYQQGNYKVIYGGPDVNNNNKPILIDVNAMQPSVQTMSPNP
tara:strand:- start:1035 stop:2207 length:1173 start_codon:yes stop_codon:yes gene_type:complete